MYVYCALCYVFRIVFCIVPPTVYWGFSLRRFRPDTRLRGTEIRSPRLWARFVPGSKKHHPSHVFWRPASKTTNPHTFLLGPASKTTTPHTCWGARHRNHHHAHACLARHRNPPSLARFCLRGPAFKITTPHTFCFGPGIENHHASNVFVWARYRKQPWLLGVDLRRRHVLCIV